MEHQNIKIITAFVVVGNT